MADVDRERQASDPSLSAEVLRTQINPPSSASLLQACESSQSSNRYCHGLVVRN